MKDLAKRDSWDDPRDKRTVLAFKIAHLLARPAADLHVTSKPFFWKQMRPPKSHSNQTQKDGFPQPVLFPKGVHQVYRLLLSGLLHFIVKLVSRASIYRCRSCSFPHTPCKKIWGAEKDLGSEEARLACANLYFHSLRSAVSQFFTCLVGYMNGLFKLVAPSQW